VVASVEPGVAREQYARFRRDNPHGPPIRDAMPDLSRPLLQRYYPQASETILSLAGFRHAAVSRVPLFGAVKVLQRPRRLGVGLCFEPASVAPELSDGVGRLLENLGYEGVFEIELVRQDDRWLLLDMNPRFYNQLAMDVARGLPLPRLAYAGARGDSGEVRRLVEAVPTRGLPRVFCNVLGLHVLLTAQSLAGSMSALEADRWRRWVQERRDVLVDAVADTDDPAPFWAEAGIQLYSGIRHPRAFVRMVALDR
jgi:hypothetical protein